MTNNKSKYTNEQLKELQSKSLEEKIQISSARIIEWYEHWNGQVCVSFSGGKDSSVLLHLVRRIYPNVKGVFSDTGLEYPEIREFVKTMDNIEWIVPKIYDRKTKQYRRCTFVDVLTKDGYPIISKEIALYIHTARNKPKGKTAVRFDPNSDYVKKYGQRYYLGKYKYLLDAPFLTSTRCCNLMKKEPLKRYQHEFHVYPYVGTMTVESNRRKQNWLVTGCNAYNLASPVSSPISFWTEQDILHYIQKYSLSYAPVYGDLIEDSKGNLHFTGCQRTGCVFCAYGCQSEKTPNRFQRLKKTHPTLYDYCMRGGKYNEDGLWVPDKGLGMDKVLKYIGVETDYESNEKNLDELTKQAVEEVEKLKEE